jgi:hypothetical protein
MKVLSRILVGAAAILTTGAIAHADTASVEYLIQRKPLATTTVASDKLVFKLYSDDECGSPIGEMTASAGDNAVHFERVKGQRIGRLKAADYVRLSAILPDVPAASTHVRVEGPGIVPAKTICQPHTVASNAVRIVDLSVTEQLLDLAGVGGLEELRTVLERGDVSNELACELLITVLGEESGDLHENLCGASGPQTDPEGSLGGLLSLN